LKKALLLLIVCFVLVTGLVIGGCSGSVGGEGVLNLSSSDPTTLDPAIAGDSTSSEYILQIYSGLLRLDDKLKLVGDIALDWNISPDGLVYTFKLRQDVKFQNGRSLTAPDFKYSWERAASPATNSQTALTYLGDIVGISDIIEGKAGSAPGIEVIDDYNLQVTIDSPKSYFLNKLTYPTAFAVAKENVSSGTNWWRKPVGTGPFSLKEWTQNTSLTLERNSTYYGDLAKLNQVKYQFFSGNSMDLYEKGEIDITGVSTSYIEAVRDPGGSFIKDLVESSSLGLSYIGFNCSAPPFDDVNIRKAFSLALDKEKIDSLLYKDMVQKADGILPPGMPGFNPNLVGLKYDVTMAKELIKSSKYGDIAKFPSITLTTSGYGGGGSPALQALIYQWKQNLGVDVRIRQLEPETYFYNLKTEKDQMFDMGWSADYPHPQDFLDILFSSGTNNNYGQYSNPAVDDLIKKANQEINADQSYAYYQQAEQMIVDDAACIPLTFGKNYLLIKSYVKGYSLSPLGFADLNKVSILSH
jgi:oligopeptide transport system substrate-binding protein